MGKNQEQAELAAKCAYEARRGFFLAQGEFPAQWQKWEDLPEARRDSLIGAAYYIARNAVLPEDLHDRWAKQRRSEGWRMAEYYNRKLKQNPDLVDWQLLPAASRAKFEFFLLCVQMVVR